MHEPADVTDWRSRIWSGHRNVPRRRLVNLYRSWNKGRCNKPTPVDFSAEDRRLACRLLIGMPEFPSVIPIG
ncbi:hypothetical protein CGZ80_11135 [Rhodopirellula sp. MGV]|nr:hypothetical protein CGZ80_11135 [Rhodopirellula sp. MGV]PNY34041.1 hypothetical protein C2E31_25410 [Rhodopirellula baltica]PNY35650.1 hypothetical protein C2E31_17085 [Rhodopirellula baltica]